MQAKHRSKRLIPPALLVALLSSLCLSAPAEEAELKNLGLEQLIKETRHKDPARRILAIEVAAERSELAAELVPHLINRLDDFEKVFVDERRYTSPSQAAVKGLVAIGQPAFEPLKQALGSESKQRRANAADALAKMGHRGRSAIIAAAADGTLEPFFAGTAMVFGTDKAVGELIALLLHEDTAVRVRAIQTTDAMQPRGPAASAIPDLILALDADEDPVAYAASEALTSYTSAVIDPLIEVLKSGTTRQRRFAYRTLGEMGPVSGDAINAINERLWSTEEVAEARWALNTLTEIAERGERARGAERLVVAMYAGAGVNEVKQHPNPEFREIALKLSARLKQPEALDPTLEHLERAGSNHAKRDALRSLKHLAAVEETALKAVRAAEPLIDSDDHKVRLSAFDVLGAAKGDAARKHVIEALTPLLDLKEDHEQGELPRRLLAAAALGRLGDERAAGVLVGAVADGRYRGWVAPILAELRDERGGKAMLGLFLKRDEPVYPLIDALGQMQYGPAIQPLIAYIADHPDTDAQHYSGNASKALWRIGEPAIPAVLMAAKDRSRPTGLRLAMLSSLERHRSPALAGDLVALLDDPDPDVADAAGLALQPIARRAYGTDAKLWKQWWKRNKTKLNDEQ
ncbi:MAG: hypothetical protein AAF711_08720 [Planctomycetota bacterium]